MRFIRFDVTIECEDDVCNEDVVRLVESAVENGADLLVRDMVFLGDAPRDAYCVD